MKSSMRRKGVVFMVFLLVCGAVYGAPWLGSGTEGDPYQVWDANDMQAIGADKNYWEAHFKLMADIDLGAYTGTSFNIIGKRLLESSYGIALDTTAEKMYWTDSGTGKIQRANLDGTGIEELVTEDLVYPRGIDLDTVSGKMYWTDSGTDKIQRANLDGTGVEELVTGLSSSLDIALDVAGGKMYWTDSGTDKIQRANLDGTGVEDLVTTGLSYPTGISLDTGGGKMYWTDYGTDKIQRANLDGTGVEDLITTGLDLPRGIALDVSGGKMYWTDAGADKIQRANLNGTGVEDLVTTGLSYPFGIALDVAGGKMYWTDAGTDKIQQANLDGTGELILLENGFKGVFDGNSHVISNFTYDSNGTDCIGLFGYIYDPNAEIKNLGLLSPDVNAGDGYRVGALVGYLASGIISGCYVEGCSVTGSEYYVGGLVGTNSGSISGCYSTGVVSGKYYVGGLIGQNGGSSSKVTNSYSRCSVAGSGYSVGYVGGLIGYNSGGISYCYSTGSVSGTTNIGGLVGKSTASAVGSFWDIETSGIDYSAAGTGLTTAQMQSLSTFAESGWGGCSNNGAWTIDDGNDYPRLAWEGQAGVAIGGELSDYLGGAGTAGEPYLIYNASELNLVGVFPCELDAHFLLMADIDMGSYTGTSYNIIGTGIPFTGIFDGNGHTISNFTYDSSGSYCVGLFGYIDDPNTEIRDLGLIDPNISAVDGLYVGALVGQLAGGSLSGCYVEGGSVSGEFYAGGLVGDNFGNISNCYYEGSVTGMDYVGGLVGYNEEGAISDCNSTGSVTGARDDVGGLVGRNEYGDITGCYSMCGVSGRSSIGGLVGENREGEISDCNSSGSVTGGERLGGLVGANWGDMLDCHSTGSVNGNHSVGGLVGYNLGDLMNCSSTCDVTGGDYAGGLVGGNREGEISDCYSTGSVTGNDVVGGLVGYNDSDSNIIDSYSIGDVTGDSYVGGLVGESEHDSIISRCYSAGDVTASGGTIGGLIGRTAGSSIYNCYSEGDITGEDEVGGLVGRGGSCEIINSYSNSFVDGNDDYTTGGLGGMIYKSQIVNCYWDVNSSGLDVSSGGLGLTTSQMQSESTYLFWGCEGDWTIDDGNDYPRLAWEVKAGKVIDYGCGTEVDPYLVCEAGSMQMIGADKLSSFYNNNMDKHYKLTANIDLSAYTGMVFNIIGCDYNPFKGVFDGDGHTISNLTYDSNEGDFIGLFGAVSGSTTEIRNLGLIDPNIRAGTGDYVGCLAGGLAEGAITGCYVEGGNVSGRDYVGGLLGYNSFGNIADCYSKGDVSGDNDAGGLVGYNSDSSISNCYSVSNTIEGLCVGGIVGYNYSSNYTACFWDSEVNPDVNGIGNTTDPNVIGLPTVLMQTESTYTDAGWDFVGEIINGPNDIWDICEGTNYPKLVWQIPVGDFVCPDGVDMFDFGVLGDAWMSGPGDGHWDPNCDISEPNDNVIDGRDLGVFVGNWLEGL